jgi:hypothetical protein
MTRGEIIAAWNAQVDDANRWHHLGEDEKLEWTMKLEREACAKVCDDYWKKSIDCGDKAGALQCVGIRTSIRARGNT